MKDKDMKQFSLTAFFLVTGFSFLFFSKLMHFLDGSRLPLFTLFGAITLVIGLLIMITSLKKAPEKR